jgi:Asp-tRNA(Asn)/Glu-tRNA(Gln) amidotransferase C subunit
MMRDPVTAEEMQALANVADLGLPEERLEPVAELLNAWLPAANELSRTMADDAYMAIMPITAVVHPDNGDKD